MPEFSVYKFRARLHEDAFWAAVFYVCALRARVCVNQLDRLGVEGICIYETFLLTDICAFLQFAKSPP